MGAASGIISGVSQVAGIAQGFMGGGGGGTVYQPDERAMYEAELYAYDSAVENHRLAESVLQGQIGAQNSFNQYEFDLQNLTIERQFQAAERDLYTQLQDAMYQNGMQRLQLEQDNYIQQQQSNTASLANEANRFATQAQLELQQLDRRAGFRFGQMQNRYQQAAVELGKAEADYNLKQLNARTDLEVEALKNQELDLRYKSQNLDFQREANDTNLQERLGLITQQELQTQRDTNLQESVARDQYGAAVSSANIGENLSKAQAENQRGDTLRDLLRQVAQSEQQFSQFQSLLGATGRDSGTQDSSIGFDQYNNETNASQRRSMMGRYGLATGASEVEAGLAKAQAQSGLTSNMFGIENTRRQSELAVKQGRQFATENHRISSNIINNQQNNLLGVGYNNITRGLAGTELDRAMNQFNYDKTNADIENQLAMLQQQRQYDIFSKSLIPEQMEQGQGLFNSFNSVLNQHQLNVNNGVAQDRTQQGRDALSRQGLVDTEAAKNQWDNLVAQYGLQANSALASHTANQGNTRMQEYAGLNQLGAQTHGLLSQLGNYRQPPPN